VTYEEYITSPRWAALRQEALARDGFRCRGCNTTEDLEVHHRCYPAVLGTETIDDLTTLCGGSDGCHHALTTLIRRRHYAARVHKVDDVERIAPAHIESAHAVREIEVSSYQRIGPDLSQWAPRQPARSDSQGDEKGIGQAGQD
jgi:hypothetical protein